MDSTLLKFLCCPETAQPLRFANKTELEELNTLISSRSAFNRAGNIIHTPLEAALIREDGRVTYPIRDDIPLLLVEEAISNYP